MNKISKNVLIILVMTLFSCNNKYVDSGDINSKEIEIKKIEKSANVDINEISKIVQTINYINDVWVGDEEIDKEKLYEAALDGMVKSLKDPYSEYLNKNDLKEFNENIDNVYVGVGMSIKKEKGDYMEVISPFIGGPAFKSGIQIGDIVTKINDEDIIDKTATEASRLLRGDGRENTKVKIEIFRKGVKKPLVFILTREVIKLENIEYKMLENNIGYISLLNFGNNNGKDVEEAINNLIKEGMEKLILDLRTNPGGSLLESVYISSLFVPDKLIVTLKYKHGIMEKIERKGEQIFKGEMVVLVNKGSASASEIVTGVLKNYNRATIIGEKTFGKGVAQSIFKFHGEKDALKLTIAEYATPKNNKINKNGINPDIYIQMNPLLSDKGYSNETSKAKENRKKSIFTILEEIEGKERAKEIIKNGDIQLKAAINYLLGEKVISNKKEDDIIKKTKKDYIIEENNKENRR